MKNLTNEQQAILKAMENQAPKYLAGIFNREDLDDQNFLEVNKFDMQALLIAAFEAGRNAK